MTGRPDDGCVGSDVPGRVGESRSGDDLPGPRVSLHSPGAGRSGQPRTSAGHTPGRAVCGVLRPGRGQGDGPPCRSDHHVGDCGGQPLPCRGGGGPTRRPPDAAHRGSSAQTARIGRQSGHRPGPPLPSVRPSLCGDIPAVQRSGCTSTSTGPGGPGRCRRPGSSTGSGAREPTLRQTTGARPARIGWKTLSARATTARRCRASTTPFPCPPSPRSRPGRGGSRRLAALSSWPGYVADPAAAGPALLRLGDAIGAPVLADPLSGARFGPDPDRVRVGSYDLYLRDARVMEALEPDLILRFGAAPTSAALGRYLEANRGVPQLVAARPGRWTDHAALAWGICSV